MLEFIAIEYFAHADTHDYLEYYIYSTISIYFAIFILILLLKIYIFLEKTILFVCLFVQIKIVHETKMYPILIPIIFWILIMQTDT